jgi:hypothetical protein
VTLSVADEWFTCTRVDEEITRVDEPHVDSWEQMLGHASAAMTLDTYADMFEPAFDALHSLICGEWWHAAEIVTTDDAGALELSGFAGIYRGTGVEGSGQFEQGTERVVLA